MSASTNDCLAFDQRQRLHVRLNVLQVTEQLEPILTNVFGKTLPNLDKSALKNPESPPPTLLTVGAGCHLGFSRLAAAVFVIGGLRSGRASDAERLVRSASAPFPHPP